MTMKICYYKPLAHKKYYRVHTGQGKPWKSQGI